MRKKLTTWRLNNILLKNQWVNEEIIKEIKKYLKTNYNDDATIQNIWNAAKVVLRGELHTNTGLSQKRRKIPNWQLKPPPKRTRKRTKKTQSQQKEGNYKDQRRNQ